MRKDHKDGNCRECGGHLDVIDVSDVTLTVVCANCCESYDVETDAFGDGCMTYWPAAIAEKLKAETGDDQS